MNRPLIPVPGGPEQPPIEVVLPQLLDSYSTTFCKSTRQAALEIIHRMQEQALDLSGRPELKDVALILLAYAGLLQARLRCTDAYHEAKQSHSQATWGPGARDSIPLLSLHRPPNRVPESEYIDAKADTPGYVDGQPIAVLAHAILCTIEGALQKLMAAEWYCKEAARKVSAEFEQGSERQRGISQLLATVETLHKQSVAALDLVPAELATVAELLGQAQERQPSSLMA